MKLNGPVKKRLTLRFDEEQWTLISEVSKRANLSPAEVVREAVHVLANRLPSGWLQRVNDPPEQFQNEVRRLWFEVNRIGLNLNQLTRLAHLSGDDELKEIMSHVVLNMDMLRKEVDYFVSHRC